MLKNKKNKLSIGIDIGQSSAKAVLLEESALGISIKNFVIAAEAAQALKELKPGLEKKEIETYVCFSGSGPIIKRLSLSKIPEKQIKEAVAWEFKTHIPFPLEAVKLDYFILEKTEAKIEIMAVAVLKETLQQRLKLIQEKIRGVTAAPFALWEILGRNVQAKNEEIIGLIDIGTEISSLAVFKNNRLQFTREISLGGNNFTKIMSGQVVADQWQLNLSPAEAETLKIKYGIPAEGTLEKTDQGVPLSQILEIIKPVLRRFLNELLRSFDYYREQFHESKIDRIFITGGSANLKNLPEFLTNGLGSEVQILNPLQTIHLDSTHPKTPELKEIRSKLSLAIGTALDKAAKINLIKTPKSLFSSFNKSLAGLSKLGGSSKVLTGSLAAILLLTGASYYALERTDQGYKHKLQETQKVLSDIKTLVEKRNILRSVQKEKNESSYLIEEISSLTPASVILNQISFNQTKQNLQISGFAPALKTITQYLNRLNNSEYFSGVKLVKSHKSEVKNLPEMLFEIALKVN